LDRKGFSPNLKIVADIANLLIVQYILPAVGDLAVVGKYWVPNFIKQYKVLKSKLSRCLDIIARVARKQQEGLQYNRDNSIIQTTIL
jgi:hypothetical protein